VKSFSSWKGAKSTRAALVCALMIGGGLAVARAGFPSAHINLKVADATEGPSRITMAPAAKKAMPAVVKIAVSKLVKTPTSMQMPEGMEDNPMFRQFFGGNGFQAPRPHREAGLGSGVIVSTDGYMPQAIGPRTRRAIDARGLRPVVGDYARYASGLVAGLPWAPRLNLFRGRRQSDSVPGPRDYRSDLYKVEGAHGQYGRSRRRNPARRRSECGALRSRRER